VSLLIDIFGFLSVLLRGLVLCAQSMAIGGVAFLLFLAVPLQPELGDAGPRIVERARRLLACTALLLAGAELLMVGLQVSTLVGTLQIPPVEAGETTFTAAALTICACAVAIAIVARRPGSVPGAALGSFAFVILAAQTLSSHAAARVDGRFALGLADFAHMAAAAVWIGGLPYLCSALAHTQHRTSCYRIGRRYSLMAMASVAVLVGAGGAMAAAYAGSLGALYGTGYGVMVGTKVLLLAGMLLLGAMNFRIVSRLRRDPAASAETLRRFAEAELGIGLTALLAAASLTSQPPGVDLTSDRAAWSEVVERLTPRWPRLTSPEADTLAIARLDAGVSAAAGAVDPPQAFVPGEGVAPPRNAMDLAWSEFNHHWAGLIVLGIGLVALLERAGYRSLARHWPLVLAGLAIPMFARADPEVWPMGGVGMLESLRDPEVVQHRLLECLTAAFGVLEWRVRTGRTRDPRAALVFPLLCAVGGALLVTHSHALANVKEQLLIEITHVPLAAAAMIAGWSRWIEVRLHGRASRVAGWIWPIAFAAAGVSLLLYREQ
jgi:putative copper resistance protein D